MWPQPGAHTKAVDRNPLGNNLQLMLTSQLVERGAGDDGDSSLVELVDLLAGLNRKVHSEEKVLPGAVQIHWKNNLGCVRH